MEKGLVKKIISRALIVFLFINFVFLIYFFSYHQPYDRLEVIFLDIGQGDAILIKTPQNKNILIDGGPDKGIIYKIDQYLPINNRQIDLMILTHPDPDHFIGLMEVLSRLKVKKIITNGARDNSSAYLLFEKLIKEKELTPLVIKKSLKIDLGEEIYLDFFWPKEDLENKILGDNNYFSLVFKMVFKKINFLFTGDADEKAEEEIIFSEEGLKADVLKVGHHGSKYSSSLDFLRKVKPQYAVISCGKNNKFGHPNLRVLKNLEIVGAKVFRTDELGDIIFETDGSNLFLSRYARSREAGK